MYLDIGLAHKVRSEPNWCNRHVWDWYWGAPYPADCEGLNAPEVALVSTLTYVEFDSNQNLKALEGVFEAQGTDALGGAPMGFGIRTPEPGVSVGGQESYVENWQIDWSVSGLTSNFRSIDLTWKHNDLQTFDTGDKFHVGTLNNRPHHDYVDFTVGDAVTTWELSGSIDNEPGKPSRSVWNGQFHLNLEASPLMDALVEVNSGATRVKMVNLPSEITATWWKDNSRDTGGTRKHFELQTPTDKREFELRGRTEVQGSDPWKYSWVGLPHEVEIVADTEDCCTPKVYSVDIREPRGSAGHLRSLNLNGDLEDKNFDVEMTISKINRTRWVFGDYDWWMNDGEDNAFIRNGANFYGSNEAYSVLNLEKSSGTSLWDPFDTHHNRLIAQDHDSYKWEVSDPPDATPDEGWIVYVDNAGHNQYGWAIAESELDKRCEIAYDSGDCP